MSDQVSRPPTPDLDDAVRSGVLATTNYGAQVAYNYGSVSNFFCHSSDAAHQCHFPDISSDHDSFGEQIHKTIEQARELYHARRWEPAKALFYDVLYAPYTTLVAEERILLQYNLAHTHFALAEFADAARQFQDVMDIHQERNETADKTVSDSRYWLARSFYHLDRHADASEELQLFVLTHNQQDTRGAEQATTARLWLGLTFERLGQNGLAKAQLIDAFESQVQRFGPEHLKTLACRHHLANFLYKRKEFPEAQEHFQILLSVEDNLNGPEKEEAMRTRCMLAFCLTNMGRYGEAEPHLERVHARINSLKYLMHDEVRDMGLVCYWLGRISLYKKNEHSVAEAGRLFQRALQMISNFINYSNRPKEGDVALNDHRGNSGTSSKEHDNDLQDELMGCRCYQAHAMRFQSQFVAAEQAYRQILDTTSVAGQEYIIASRHGLARSLIAQKKLAEAKVVLEEVVSVKSSLEGCRHTGEDLGACMHALGEVHKRLGQHSQARDCYQRVVDAVPEEATQAYNEGQLGLGVALFNLRQFESARSHLHHAYQFAVRNNRNLLLQIECWLSWSLCEVGRYGEAEAHLRPAFTILPGSKDGDIWLGYSHFYQGRAALHRQNLPEATKHLRIGLSKIARHEGLRSPTYLGCRYQLAYCLYMQRHYDEARLIFEELQKIEALVEPLQDIRLVLAPQWLGRIAYLQNKSSEALEHFTECLEHMRGDTLPLHVTISIGIVRFWRAKSLHTLGKDEECAEVLKDILGEQSKICEDMNRTDLYSLSRLWLGQSLHAAKKFEEACEYLAPAVADLERQHGFDASEVSKSRVLLVDSLSEMRRHDEAAPHLARLRTVQDLTPMIRAIANYWLGRRAFRQANPGQGVAEGHFSAAQKWEGLKMAKWKHMRMDCQHFLARLQLRDKKYAHADEVLQELARQQYESGDTAHAVDNQHWLGRSLYTQRKYTAAILVFQKIISDIKPGRVEEYAVAASQHWMGNCLFNQHKTKEAKSHYEMALQSPYSDSATLIVHLRIGHCDFNMKMYEEAKADYQCCLDQIASDPESTTMVHYWLGRTNFELRDWKQSDISFNLAIFAEDNPLSESMALEAHCYTGRARIAAKNYSEALDPLLSIQNKFSKSTSPTFLLSQYYLSLAWFENGRFGASRRTLVRLLARYKEKSQPSSDVLPADFLLARCLVGLGLNLKTKTELERIVKIPWYKICAKPSDQTIMLAQYDLARIAFRTSDWTRAVERFQETLIRHESVHVEDSSLDPVHCHRYLALTCQALQWTEEASNFYQKVLDGQTDEAAQAPPQSLLDVQICLGRTLYRLDKRAGCEDVTQEAGDWPGTLSGLSHPYNVRQQILLADLAVRLSDFERAERFYAKLLALMEASDEARRLTPVPVAYLHSSQAVVLSKLERYQEAQDHGLKALEADCAHAHGCTSVDGFTQAFSDLVPETSNNSEPGSEKPSSAACPIHPPETKIKARPPVYGKVKHPRSRTNAQKTTEIQAPQHGTSQTQASEQLTICKELPSSPSSGNVSLPILGQRETSAEPSSKPQTNKQLPNAEQPKFNEQSQHAEQPDINKQAHRSETTSSPMQEQQDSPGHSSSVQPPPSPDLKNGEMSPPQSKHSSSPTVVVEAPSPRKAPPRPKPKPAHLQRRIVA